MPKEGHLKRLGAARNEKPIIRLVIPGDPAAKGRPRFKGHAYTDTKTSRAEANIRWRAFVAKVRPQNGNLAVSASFYRRTHRRVDIDNLAKLVLDALNGIAWKDDSQIVELHLSKGYDAADPRTVVTVEAI